MAADPVPPVTGNERERDLRESERLMEVLAESGDPESAHATADDLLCSALLLLGQSRLVSLFERVPKWYA